MNWLKELIKVLPIIADMTDNKVDDLLAQLVNRADMEIERRMAAGNKTRAEILAEGSQKYEEVLSKIDRVKKLGHENE
jgi:hypothetical protein